MRVLITGSAGFIGTHLTQKFLDKGHSVIGLDDFFTGKKENMKFFIDHANFTFVEGDVRRAMVFDVDLIINLASPASPQAYQLDPVRTIETNFIGTLNLLKICQATGARILQASTSEIYGDPLESPQRESYWGNVNPIGLRSCYDEGKRAAESLCFDFWRQYGVDARVVRIFNTYGPYMAVNDGRVVSNFINQAIRDKPLRVFGTGMHTRSFCYVSDLVSGIYDISTLTDSVETPINLGNCQEILIKDLAELVIKLSKSKSLIINTPLPQDDPKQRKPDLSLAKKLINWSPKVQLVSGLQQTIEYFKNIK